MMKGLCLASQESIHEHSYMRRGANCSSCGIPIGYHAYERDLPVISSSTGPPPTETARAITPADKLLHTSAAMYIAAHKSCRSMLAKFTRQFALKHAKVHCRYGCKIALDPFTCTVTEVLQHFESCPCVTGSAKQILVDDLSKTLDQIRRRTIQLPETGPFANVYRFTCERLSSYLNAENIVRTEVGYAVVPSDLPRIQKRFIIRLLYAAGHEVQLIRSGPALAYDDDDDEDDESFRLPFVSEDDNPVDLPECEDDHRSMTLNASHGFSDTWSNIWSRKRALPPTMVADTPDGAENLLINSMKKRRQSLRTYWKRTTAGGLPANPSSLRHTTSSS